MRRALPVGLVSLVGVLLFLWPFVGSGLPANTPAWTLTLACVAGLFLVEAGTRQLDSRAVALLAAIAAIDTAVAAGDLTEARGAPLKAKVNAATGDACRFFGHPFVGVGHGAKAAIGGDLLSDEETESEPVPG